MIINKYFLNGYITKNNRFITRINVLFLEGETMFDYSKCMNRLIFCIDLCSLFASCACVLRGLDPLKVKLAVVGDVNRNGSIVLAATLELEKLGISTATRLYEIPRDTNIIVVNATMRRYVEISNQITEIYTKYVALENLHF